MTSQHVALCTNAHTGICGLFTQVLSSRERQLELWTELGLAVPSQSRLDSIGRKLRHAMAEADETFVHLLRMNPTSIPVMRRYAAFLRDVSGCCFRAWWFVCVGTAPGRSLYPP